MARCCVFQSIGRSPICKFKVLKFTMSTRSTRFQVYEVYKVPSSRLEVGGWRLKLEVGGWGLVVESWKLEV